MSSLQHYLSRCIIRNFVTKSNNTFFEYDCVSGKLSPKNLNKLFAGYRLWSEKFEETLGREFENKLAPVLKKYANCSIKTNYTIGLKSIEIPQFSGFQINDENDHKILSKIIFQQVLLCQRDNNLEEEKISRFFENESLKIQYPVLFEIARAIYHPPLILVDGMVFTFLAPDKNISKIGHVCFMCPISTNRFIVWGNQDDCDFFAKKYSNINYLNLCMIEQQDKQCKIASQDKDYIIWLSSHIRLFNSGENIKIKAIRSL